MSVEQATQLFARPLTPAAAALNRELPATELMERLVDEAQAVLNSQ